MASDAIVLLKNDHRELRRVFREFRKAGEDKERKRRAADRMIELLTVHTYLENEVMYPEVRKVLPDLEDDVLESYEEHHVADLLCRELLELDPTNEHFDAKTTVLIENVEHHMAEEEQEWFPKVRSGLGRKALLDLGQRLEEVRRQAPSNPDDPRAVASARKAVTA
jgi:iron-sulfur cluster repair protein YtfE (RIC family)